MTKKTFEKIMAKAMAMQSIERSEYWSGFQRGVRRLYHGENFGTPAEHEQWLNCDTGDGIRAELQLGYRTGFYYDRLDPEKPGEFRDMLGLTNKALADMIWEKPRTVENWMTGRLSKRGKILLKNLIP